MAQLPAPWAEIAIGCIRRLEDDAHWLDTIDDIDGPPHDAIFETLREIETSLKLLDRIPRLIRMTAPNHGNHHPKNPGA